MSDYSEIFRYMGHNGTASTQLETLVSSCLEKLAAVCTPRHVAIRLPCMVTSDHIVIGALDIKSKGLAAHLCNCTQAYIFAATLGASVDRLITRRTRIDSAEGLCIQACAAVQIENYCDTVEQQLSCDIDRHGLYLRPRFSPGYDDFDAACQTDILYMLQAHKRIGVTETKTHILTPLKSVTAVVGISTKMTMCASKKCVDCGKTDCPFQDRGPIL